MAESSDSNSEKSDGNLIDVMSWTAGSDVGSLESARFSEISLEPILLKAFSTWSLNQQEQDKSHKCKYHEHQRLSFYCEKCNVPICSDCILKIHKGHKREDMYLTLSKYSAKLEKIQDKLQDDIEKLKKGYETYTNTLKEIEAMQDNQTLQVNTDFEKIIAMLTERKNALIEDISNKCSSQRETLKNRCGELKMQHAQLQSLLDKLKCARKESTNVNVMKIYGEIMAKQDGINKELDKINASCIRKIKVVLDEDQTFKRKLETFGKIKFE